MYTNTGPIAPGTTFLQLDLHVHTGRKIEFHQRINRFVRRVNDVHQPQMTAYFELLARRLVDVGRTQQVETLLARRQGDRALDHCAGTFSGIDNLEGRLVDQPVVEGFESDADFLVFQGGHVHYSIILATTPAPTVRPPSRMAKRSPSSIAIGWISATVIEMLSPGITISVPCGNSIEPVTSVVRK